MDVKRIEELFQSLRDINGKLSDEIQDVETKHGKIIKEVLVEIVRLLPENNFGKIEGTDSWGDKSITKKGIILGNFETYFGNCCLVALGDNREIVAFEEKRVGVLCLDEPIQISDVTDGSEEVICAEICDQFIDNIIYRGEVSEVGKENKNKGRIQT